MKKEWEYAVAFLAPVDAPTKLWAVYCTASRNFQSCSFCFWIHIRGFWGALAEITTTLTPVYTGTLRMLFTLNISLAARLAGGTGRTELVGGSTFPGWKKCPCSSFCECQQLARAGGWEGGAVLCVVPAAVVGEERHTRTSSQRISEHRASRVLPQVCRDPPIIPHKGPWASFGEQCRDQNGGSRAAKLTRSPQKDAEFCCHSFVVRNAYKGQASKYCRCSLHILGMSMR